MSRPLMLWVNWPLVDTFTEYLGKSNKFAATGVKSKAIVKLKANGSPGNSY